MRGEKADDGSKGKLEFSKGRPEAHQGDSIRRGEKK